MAGRKGYGDGGRSRGHGKPWRRTCLGRHCPLIFTSCRDSPLMIGYLTFFPKDTAECAKSMPYACLDIVRTRSASMQNHVYACESAPRAQSLGVRLDSITFTRSGRSPAGI
jgi:hypothetical protein